MVKLEARSANVMMAAGVSANRVRGSGQASARTRRTPYAMNNPPKPIASVARNVHIPADPTRCAMRLRRDGATAGAGASAIDALMPP